MPDEYPQVVHDICDALASIGMARATYASQVSITLTSDEALPWLDRAVEGDTEDRSEALEEIVAQTDAAFNTPDTLNHEQRVEIVRDAVLQVAQEGTSYE
jgi:hypothetical protein